MVKPAGVSSGATPEPPRYAVSQSLREYAQDQDSPSAKTPDAFMPSDDWMASLRHKPVEVDTSQALASGFMEHHRLSSVICFSGQSTAIVDEKVIRVGDVLDGFKLLSIQPDSVVFAAQGVNVVLKVSHQVSDK